VGSLKDTVRIRNLHEVRIGRIRATFDLVIGGVVVSGCRVVANENGRLAFVSAPCTLALDGRYKSNVHFRRVFAEELLNNVLDLLSPKKPL
jgi:DNA-binding cell septation regulator SpoVG